VDPQWKKKTTTEPGSPNAATTSQARLALTRRLEELTRSPETLLVVPAGELLDALARGYREAIEAFVTSRKEVPRGGPGGSGHDEPTAIGPGSEPGVAGDPEPGGDEARPLRADPA
jgi:hypothetical protein